MIFKLVKTHIYCGASRYTGYEHKTIMLTLECGHEQFRKLSCGVPNKARCKECERNIIIDEFKLRVLKEKKL